MRGRFTHRVMLTILLIWQIHVCVATESSDPNENSKYLDAVREFADNVLKYGRDTYGPKHTPLFVDGLNIHTHEPVKWIIPDGQEWVLSNFASQQNLFRTLDGLSNLTGDPKYKKAAEEAIKYALDNLQSPSGLFYWGGHSAYDAQADKPCGRGTHELKGYYPYYELMWEVNPKATRQYIEAFWAGHILDWSSLSMNRHYYEMSKPLISHSRDHGTTNMIRLPCSKVAALVPVLRQVTYTMLELCSVDSLVRRSRSIGPNGLPIDMWKLATRIQGLVPECLRALAFSPMTKYSVNSSL